MSDSGANTIYIVGEIAKEPCELQSALPEELGRTRLFRSGAKFIEHLEQDANSQSPACLLLDLEVADRPPFELLIHLQGKRLLPPTIIVTSKADVRSAVRALQSGAIDLFEQPASASELAPRVAWALQESRRRRETSEHRANIEVRWSRLTAGERTVARMICEGKSSREIGEALGLGRRTIENRRANIMVKMGVGSLAHLVRSLCGVGPDFPPPEVKPA